jgi:hypothetical protein
MEPESNVSSTIFARPNGRFVAERDCYAFAARKGSISRADSDDRFGSRFECGLTQILVYGAFDGRIYSRAT